jgi:hypothetical protein
MLLDIYTRICPQRYFAAMVLRAPKLENMGKRLRSVNKLLDLEERFREMDEYGDYRQFISLPTPIEEIAAGPLGNELAYIANEGMAELCAAHPDRFPAFVAAVNLHDVDAASREAERALGCGARGVQIFTNVAGHPSTPCAISMPIPHSSAGITDCAVAWSSSEVPAWSSPPTHRLGRSGAHVIGWWSGTIDPGSGFNQEPGT